MVLKSYGTEKWGTIYTFIKLSLVVVFLSMEKDAEYHKIGKIKYSLLKNTSPTASDRAVQERELSGRKRSNSQILCSFVIIAAFSFQQSLLIILK